MSRAIMTIMILNWENILFNEQRRITMHHRPWEKQCVRLTNSTTSLIDARCPIFQSSFLNSKCSAEVSAPVQPLVRAEMGSSPSREPEKSTGWLHRSLLLSSNTEFGVFTLLNKRRRDFRSASAWSQTSSCPVLAEATSFTTPSLTTTTSKPSGLSRNSKLKQRPAKFSLRLGLL